MTEEDQIVYLENLLNEKKISIAKKKEIQEDKTIKQELSNKPL